MKKDFFDELLESVAEGGEILRGERQPSRAFRYDEPLSGVDPDQLTWLQHVKNLPQGRNERLKILKLIGPSDEDDDANAQSA
jgi:hypothetical protein